MLAEKVKIERITITDKRKPIGAVSTKSWEAISLPVEINENDASPAKRLTANTENILY